LDLFTKCYEFTRADEVKASGLYPYFRSIEESEGPTVQIEGRKVVMAGSNNYLGLTADPRVKEAAINAIKKYGTGCSGSRYLTGTIDLHVQLEEKLTKFMEKEAVLLFSTGFQTAQGIIPTLVHRNEYVISDRDNHASIVAGNLIAKSGTAFIQRYRHNDMKDLKRILEKIGTESNKLIISDGVFSTYGDIVDLPSLNQLAKKYNAKILIDDAHAIGIIGKNGKGTASEFNLTNEIDMTFGTFSKTFASLGGFVAAKAKVIDYIKHHAPALIFSASPTPASVASAMAALDILIEEPWRVEKVINNANKMRKGLRDIGFDIIDGKTAIVPVIIGDDELAFKFWRLLFDGGVFVNAFISPVVPKGKQMIRTSYMSTHEDSHLEYIIDTFKKNGKKLGLI
jgi:8-amino-7-oxononanoate synthase